MTVTWAGEVAVREEKRDTEDMLVVQPTTLTGDLAVGVPKQRLQG